MVSTMRSIASLLLSYGLLLMANGLFGTLLGVRAKIEDFSTDVIGVVMASYFLGLLLGARFAVRAVISVGHIRAFAAFASVMSVSALMHVLLTDPIAWSVLRLFSGFCMAGMIMVTESWLNERATNTTRGQILSIYMITNYFAAGCGQFLLPLADPAKFQLFSVASILFSLALVPVLLTQATAPKPVEPMPLELGKLYRTSPLGVIGVCAAGLVNATFYGLGPVFARSEGLSLTQTSAFMASVILGGLVLQWPVGRLSDRIDRRWVLVGVSFGTLLACIGIVLATRFADIWLFAIGAVYGGFSFTVYSICAAHANDFSEPGNLVQTASGLLIAYGCGAVAGPIIAANAMSVFGPPGMFAFSAVVSAMLAFFAFYRMRRRATKRRAERKPFVPTPAAQHLSRELTTRMRDQLDRDLAQMSTTKRY